MAKSKMSREALLPKLAQHVLEHGLASASLRPLAKAAGTSDRMLIYHFGNKQKLVEALLDQLAELYSNALDAAMPEQRAKSRADCATQIVTLTRQQAFAPFLRLWWEIVAASAAGDLVFRQSAQQMLQSLLSWLEAQMPNDDPDPEAGAKLVFAVIEGTLMFDALERGEIGDTAITMLES